MATLDNRNTLITNTATISQPSAKESILTEKKFDRAKNGKTFGMPSAVWFIEFAERFSFYGISPLLNVFFRDYMKLGSVAAIELSHGFKFLSYFTALCGAAMSDLLFGKYHTIVVVSLLYVFGVTIAAVFSAPYAFGLLRNNADPVLVGPIIGFILVAFGTGGIKACLSSLGGDQFLESEKASLNTFYSYFYWYAMTFVIIFRAINGGSFFSGIITPILVNQQCFASTKSCYPEAFGVCGLVMVLSLALFLSGTRMYKVYPKTGIFMPWVALKVVCVGFRNYMRATKIEKLNSPSIISFARNYSPEVLKDVHDLTAFMMILIPAPFFWFVTEQQTTSWQNQYAQMNQTWFGLLYISEEQSSVLNGLLILILVPIFSKLIYPAIQRFKPFSLIDRMITGMILSIVATMVVGFIQIYVDRTDSFLVFDPTSGIYKCDQTQAINCVSGTWQFLPYFLMTCAKVLYTVSGLNLSYEEVGKSTKASASSLWLLMMALGNLIVISVSRRTNS